MNDALQKSKLIEDMQTSIYRLAELKWKINRIKLNELFLDNDVFGYIDECYDLLHLKGYKYVLEDIETMLKNRGVNYAT